MKPWLATIIVFALLSCSHQNIITPAHTAVIVAFEGNVTLNYAPVHEGMTVNVNDRLMTGSESEVTVVLFDNSRMQVWDNSTLLIKKLDSSSRVIEINQTNGQIWVRILPESHISQMEVMTPSVVATVRGTGFWISYFNDTTGIGVTDGIVAVKRIVEGTTSLEQPLQREQQVFITTTASGMTAAAMESQALNTFNIQPLVHDEFITENLQKDKEFIADLQTKKPTALPKDLQ